jgi:GTPase
LIEIEQEISPPRRALLVGLETGREGRWEIEDSLDELSQLARTAGMETVGRAVFKRLKPHPATFIGTGSAQGLAARCREGGVTDIIFNEDLSPAQLRNLEDASGVEVRDRTELILIIFARRAQTREARLQVELARLEYLLPRLGGAWRHLSRQKGGMLGTRDAGEKQIELDRRLARNRIHALKNELEGVRRQRTAQRKHRRQTGVPVVSIIGYTNSGKSTLLNALTAAAVRAEDRLFATLDPVTRQAFLPSGRKVLFSDTVGFIRHLPHHLIESFRATLEEAAEADLLLEVLDISHPRIWERKKVVEDVLKELGADRAPMIVALNKIDLVRDPFLVREVAGRLEEPVLISARAGEGLDRLLEAIDQKLSFGRRNFRLLIPQRRPDLVAALHRDGRVLKIDYHLKDVYLEVRVEERDLGEARDYILKK